MESFLFILPSLFSSQPYTGRSYYYFPWYLSHQHISEVFVGSCKVGSHCLGITSTLMLPIGLVQSIPCGGSNFFLSYFSILCWLNPLRSLSFQARLPTTRYLMGGRTLGFHSIGRERVAPQTMSSVHYAHTSSLAQQSACLH